MKEERYRQALAYNPDIVTIKLGTNDTKPQNWRYKSDFKKDMETMIRTIRALPSKPEIYLCYPIPAYAVQWGIMPLVPGLAFVNAIRDLADSDYLAGTVKMIDAVMVFVYIAIGVGTALSVYHHVLGGIL